MHSFYARARANMIEGQVRPNKITDLRLIEAMASLPREAFLPDALRPRAYADEDVILAPGRILMEPMVAARLIQEAALKPGQRAAVLPAATGYEAALLAMLGAEVLALETDSGGVQRLSRVFSEANFPQIRTLVWSKDQPMLPAPVDVLLLIGAIDGNPEHLAPLLAEGGRILGVDRGDRVVGHACLWQNWQGRLLRRVLFDAQTPRVQDLAAPAVFTL